MRHVRALLVAGTALLAVVLGLPAGSAAAAAAATVGYDVSYPQCGSSLPRDRAFAIVGVNGGLATKPNPCLATQLAWARRSSGTMPAQPKVQLYLNTANPGEVRDQVTTWPEFGQTPYGPCDEGNTAACSWQYGWERAQHSVNTWFLPAARTAGLDADPARYTWWLDVETINTWQSGSSEALARNRATLEGMTAYLAARGAQVGLYSTGYQWGLIVGTVGEDSSLYSRNTWLAGATSLSGATANCGRTPLVAGGAVVLTQYVRGGLDRNHSCG